MLLITSDMVLNFCELLVMCGMRSLWMYTATERITYPEKQHFVNI